MGRQVSLPHPPKFSSDIFSVCLILRYFWNFFLVFFLVTLTGWSAIAGEYRSVITSNHLEAYYSSVAIASLALLTNVSLKAWVSSRLPRIAYMTALDIYILVWWDRRLRLIRRSFPTNSQEVSPNCVWYR